LHPHAGYFRMLSESTPEIGTRWRSEVNSNCVVRHSTHAGDANSPLSPNRLTWLRCHFHATQIRSLGSLRDFLFKPLFILAPTPGGLQRRRSSPVLRPKDFPRPRNELVMRRIAIKHSKPAFFRPSIRHLSRSPHRNLLRSAGRITRKRFGLSSRRNLLSRVSRMAK
jgi:hypothetical protein